MIIAYIYDFISFLFEEQLRDKIKSVILYGSVASGEFDDESDVDIFINIWDSKKKIEIEKKVKEQLKKFEEKAARIWYPRGIKNSFSIIIDSLDSEKWKNIEHDMISNGLLLYGKFEKIPEKTTHNILISFSLNNLKQTEKMKLTRILYGQESKKKGHKYKKPGLVDENEGVKISANTIIIPVEKVKIFRKEFSKFGVSPELREIWTK